MRCHNPVRLTLLATSRVTVSAILLAPQLWLWSVDRSAGKAHLSKSASQLNLPLYGMLAEPILSFLNSECFIKFLGSSAVTCLPQHQESAESGSMICRGGDPFRGG